MYIYIYIYTGAHVNNYTRASIYRRAPIIIIEARPKPPVASALSPKSKMKLMEEVAFDNQDGKLRDFMERAHALVEEMNYIYFMSNKWRLGTKLKVLKTQKKLLKKL